MSGAAFWIAGALLIALAVFVLGVVAAQLGAKRTRRVWLSVQCPATADEAAVVLLQDKDSGRYTDIVRCSEIECGVTCARGCVPPLNVPLKRF
jgi:hypothetical protein